MPRRQRTRAQNRAAYITTARQHNALQAELDRAAEEKAADKRRNIRRKTAAAIDAMKQSLDPPSDYGDDPPPF
ncbi:hypothetical protein [Mycolicibacterium sp. OfavD-34-C]|uniref:hypothetical protein n=1 Tax=Mycolicibacterium sp. OfavD-34-C TaxID=2917746 RepID=UPI001EF61B61|nr:hypothetical protein [Mycolicibacterium sp. OfavD-34-C]MCG7583786.1 hypothetical protein [Mycolicibacterium sp. OfavD-34-C]